MNTTQSEKLYAQALDFMPGGVNSPVRACRSVGRTPLFIDRAEGSKIYDVDGNEFRSEERRVGKECQRSYRSRWSPYH